MEIKKLGSMYPTRIYHSNCHPIWGTNADHEPSHVSRGTDYPRSDTPRTCRKSNLRFLFLEHPRRDKAAERVMIKTKERGAKSNSREDQWIDDDVVSASKCPPQDRAGGLVDAPLILDASVGRRTDPRQMSVLGRAESGRGAASFV
jgi:hypothetical protein